MKFGSVDNPEEVVFTLPPDHPDTLEVISSQGEKDKFTVHVGCTKWNRADLKKFYPKGIEDELEYYATQFNSIELNATFYQPIGRDQFAKWREKTGKDFKFFPRMHQTVTHIRRLNKVKGKSEEFIEAVRGLQEKLGTVFLQLHDNFKPKDFPRLEQYLIDFPRDIKLAIEVRDAEWFSNVGVRESLFQTLEKFRVTNIILDYPGRWDLLHMRLTTPVGFVRFVGNNHSSDYTRLDAWAERIKSWKEGGLNELCFFVQQPDGQNAAELGAYFIKTLNNAMGTNLKVPVILP